MEAFETFEVTAEAWDSWYGEVMPELFTAEGTSWRCEVYADTVPPFEEAWAGARASRQREHDRAAKERERARTAAGKAAAGREPYPRSRVAGPGFLSFARVSVPDEWAVEHGFGHMSADYHAGGRRRTGTVYRLRLRHGVTPYDVAQAYLCAEAGGRVDYDPPTVEEFGGPAYPDVGYADPAWEGLTRAYRDELADWRANGAGVDAYESACARHEARAVEFGYRGGKRDAAVLEAVLQRGPVGVGSSETMEAAA